MPSIRQIAALVVLVTFIVFVAQNLGEATIHFLGWKASTSMALPLIAAYLLGGLSGRPLFRLVRSERKRERERLAKEAAAAKKTSQARDDLAAAVKPGGDGS
ncbi:MAG: hypothetical protein KJO07_08565 [Deltaproteobacteria bacterium]|jgi:uncharacterized integral membrane protein|nr:hypothetical protein [Deltaproteobacteria bacterium]